MKLLTLNTHSWMEEQPLEKLETLAQMIAAREIDIICLQEVNQRKDVGEGHTDAFFHHALNQMPIKKDNFAYLLVKRLKELEMSYHWCWMPSHIGYEVYEEGSAILSRNTLQAESFIASETTEFTDYHTRRMLGATTVVNGKDVYVMSCHFSWWEGENSGFYQEWQTTENVLSSKTVPLFLMGDLNNPSHIEGQGYTQLVNSSLPLVDSFSHAKNKMGEATVKKVIDGWENNQESLRIDYVFVSNQLEVSTYEVVFDGKRTPVVSDHFGVFVSGNWKE
ncbi:hypothetical protein RV11_GL002023 [Enterococcus phoeniculicola]|jgi:maltose 6'-phosphate phosphatase|uniref:Endonuclease/exonuclease/phosphatase domain-containing protein n=1 Tax=Enterococcus phoeniculicola ATCC BAA-412 TaxID=1158610 RepID=R3WKT0_9ENTE|nr:endonuclease/exonuclease/phosphatase family protein [Enterococcus phoeniculicola]EOL42470.1 hypothetical protein UC3_02822 [Enterococcus phoeniculicola ATCC BAA-412]EOT79251.1 hypothetical protein I589_00759 [Enterococcus phoeniculicola ATCC BAA-412]OJG73213.1 hypothetical protein RV11_GL002023 [Enterococcus phoeniculicola]